MEVVPASAGQLSSRPLGGARPMSAMALQVGMSTIAATLAEPSVEY
jgi:hypothetical protein